MGGLLNPYTFHTIYDGDGKRVKKLVPNTGETTIFIYDASGKMVAEYSTIVETAQPRVSYLTSDHLGSPRITTDANGDVYTRRDFMPFGEEIDINDTSQRTANLNYASDEIRQKFTSYERDNETELDYAQARYYSNQHGRFTSPDPLMASADIINPQTFNRYAYVGNNPLNITDPTGEIWGQLNGTLKWFKDQTALEKAGYSNYNALVGTVAGGLVVLNANGTTTAVANAGEALRLIIGAGAAAAAIEASAVALGYVAVAAGAAYLIYKAAEYNANHPGQTKIRACPAYNDCPVQGEADLLKPDYSIKMSSSQDKAEDSTDSENNKPDTSANKPLTPEQYAKKRGGELVNENSQAGEGVGRSGGGGRTKTAAGTQLIREANKLPKNDPRRAAMKKEGNRLIKQGKSISHK